MTKLELTMKLAEANARIAELNKELTTLRTQVQANKPVRTAKPEIVRTFETHEIAAERAKLHSMDAAMRSKYIITKRGCEVHYVAR